MDSIYNRPDTTYSPSSPDADARYAEGKTLCTTVGGFALEFVDRHPEAVITDAWWQMTRYFFVRSPEAVERRNRLWAENDK